jgi:hypothetical protein
MSKKKVLQKTRDSVKKMAKKDVLAKTCRQIEKRKNINKTYEDFRQFDPLKPIKNIKRPITGILHIAAHVDPRNRGSNIHDSADTLEDFIVLKRSVESLQEQSISHRPDFQLELIISINGFVLEPRYLEWFRSINETWLNDKIYCRVFQRANYGFHWAGLHDIWMRYKETNCQWYASLECDHVFMHDNWFDMVINYMKENPTVGLFGKYQREHTVQPETPLNIRVPKHLWRNGDGSTKEDARSDDLIHTCGAFCLLKRKVLMKMDDAFGCFTFGLGINHSVDGIICGEIGICQKTTALGYEVKAKHIEFLVRPIRGADRWEPEWKKVIEMKTEWGSE